YEWSAIGNDSLVARGERNASFYGTIEPHHAEVVPPVGALILGDDFDDAIHVGDGDAGRRVPGGVVDPSEHDPLVRERRLARYPRAMPGGGHGGGADEKGRAVAKGGLSRQRLIGAKRWGEPAVEQGALGPRRAIHLPVVGEHGGCVRPLAPQWIRDG